MPTLSNITANKVDEATPLPRSRGANAAAIDEALVSIISPPASIPTNDAPSHPPHEQHNRSFTLPIPCKDQDSCVIDTCPQADDGSAEDLAAKKAKKKKSKKHKKEKEKKSESKKHKKDRRERKNGGSRKTALERADAGNMNNVDDDPPPATSTVPNPPQTITHSEFTGVEQPSLLPGLPSDPPREQPSLLPRLENVTSNYAPIPLVQRASLFEDEEGQHKKAATKKISIKPDVLDADADAAPMQDECGNPLR